MTMLANGETPCVDEHSISSCSEVDSWDGSDDDSLHSEDDIGMETDRYKLGLGVNIPVLPKNHIMSDNGSHGHDSPKSLGEIELEEF